MGISSKDGGHCNWDFDGNPLQSTSFYLWSQSYDLISL